jgi:N-acetylglutamate synthase-like GNAT family acetyltransferase
LQPASPLEEVDHVGRRLLDEMFAWMSGHRLDEVWVLADNPGAVAFYLSCGFHPGEGQATYLPRELAR